MTTQTIYVPHKPTARLAEVMEQMQQMGSPVIRALWIGDAWLAIEGSHRVAAAQELGVPVEIIELDPDDVINDHDLEDCPESATAQELADYIGIGGPAYMCETEQQ